VDPDKVSAVQPNDDIEQVEADGRNDEQVHGGDVRRVVTQEGAPALGRRSRSLDHVLRDAGLSDLKAELEPWMRGAPHSGLSTLIRRISARRPASISAQPPKERDFPR